MLAETGGWCEEALLKPRQSRRGGDIQVYKDPPSSFARSQLCSPNPTEHTVIPPSNLMSDVKIMSSFCLHINT